MRDEFLRLLNEERATLGVAPVQYDDSLNLAATIRAEEELLETLSGNPQTGTHSRPAKVPPIGRLANDFVSKNVGVRECSVGFGISPKNSDYMDSRLRSGETSSELESRRRTSFIYSEWRYSKGHYEAMTDSEALYVGFGCTLDQLFNRAILLCATDSLAPTHTTHFYKHTQPDLQEKYRDEMLALGWDFDLKF